MILYMYIAPGQGLTTPWGRNFYVIGNILSLWSFVASFKKISLKSDFIQFFFNDFIHVQGSPFIKPCLRSIGLDRVISELCSKGIIL